MARRAGALASLCAVALCAPLVAHAAQKDALKAGSAVPPGQSGNTTMAQFTAVQSGASSSYGPHTDDQRVLYQRFNYKPMQFVGAGVGLPTPGDVNVKIARDPKYGIPTI